MILKGICVKCQRSFETQREQLQLATRRDDIEEIAVGLTEFSLVRQCRVGNTQLNAQTTKEQTPMPRCTLLLGPWERGYKKLVPRCRHLKASVVKWTGQVYVITKKKTRKKQKQKTKKIPVSIIFSIVQNKY